MLAPPAQWLIDPAMMTDLTPAALKQELEKYGRSQAALARHLNLDSSAVNRMVGGQRQIKAKELSKIVEYLSSTDPTSGEKSAPFPSNISNETASILKAMSIGRSGDLHQIVAVSFFAIFGNLRLSLTTALGDYAPDEENAEQFWHTLMGYPEAQILMGLGAGLFPPSVAPRLRALVKLTRMSTNMRDDEILEDNPEAIELAHQTLPFPPPQPLPLDVLRAQVALHLSSIALLALGPDAGTVQELRNMLETLEAAETKPSPPE